MSADQGRPLCAVDGCDRPVPDQAYVCPSCASRLEDDLGDVRALVAELDLTRARQDRSGDLGGIGGPRASEPLLYNSDASHDAAAVLNTLTTWVRHIAEERGQSLPHAPRPPARPAGPLCPGIRCRHGSCGRMRAISQLAGRSLSPAAAAARWLLAGGHVEWLRHRPEGPDALDELRHAVSVMRWAVDRGQPRWYAGQCGAETIAVQVVAAVFGDPPRCQTELYARPGAKVIRCPDCGTAHQTEDRQQWLLDSAREVLAHAELIGRAATALGKPITPSRIRSYAARGRIAERGTDHAGRPLYQVGEVLDVYDDNRRRRAEAVLRKAMVEALHAEHPGMSAAELGRLAGISARRAQQILAGRDTEQAQGGAA